MQVPLNWSLKNGLNQILLSLSYQHVSKSVAEKLDVTFKGEAMKMIEKANWYALYTKPKREKHVVSQLETLGVEVFMPTTRVVRVWSDRRKKLIVPLIPNYVFVLLNYKHLVNMYKVVGVTKVLSDNITKQPIVVLQKELDILREVVSMDGKVRSEIVMNGEYGNIVKGPFSGLGGTVVEYGKSIKLVASLKGIMCSFTVEIDASLCSFTYLRN